MRPYFFLFLSAFLIAGCGEDPVAITNNPKNKDFSKYSHLTINLTIKSSFGHFTHYNPPKIGHSISIKLSEVINSSKLEFDGPELNPVTMVMGGDNFSLEAISERLGIVNIRFVSKSEGHKVIFDLELFTEKKEVRGWLVTEVDSISTQGIAGLEGNYQ
jgi:hypothetical protein